MTLKPHNYENPRKLPAAWVEAYLRRDPHTLALDVMRSFDENYRLQQKVKRLHVVNVALTSIITALAFKGLEVIFQAIR